MHALQLHSHILLNECIREPERIEWWKKQDWSGFEFYPIGPGGYIFGTKNPEDICRLKVMYPFEDRRFITGIGDYYLSETQIRTQQDKYVNYADWD